MKQRHSSPKLTALERQLIERLRQHPPRLARVQSIVDLADATDGPLQSADAVEALLIQEPAPVGQHHHEPVGDPGGGAGRRRTPAAGCERAPS